MSIRILIVDDEPLAREGVLLKLRSESDIEVVGECENGTEAIKAIEALKPDLVFLDIKMPKVGGFDVIKQVGTERMPLVVFLTAYDEHAIEAFRHNALDYLLKPIDKHLFHQSMEKARKQLTKDRLMEHSARLDKLLVQLTNSLPPETKEPGTERIPVRSSGKVHLLKPEDISWVESEGDYVTVHTKDRKHLIRETMRSMEQKLSRHGFQRIHRSAIVNLNDIQELIATESGDYDVLLSGGTALKLGRNYRDALFAKLKMDT